MAERIGRGGEYVYCVDTVDGAFWATVEGDSSFDAIWRLVSGVRRLDRCPPVLSIARRRTPPPDAPAITVTAGGLWSNEAMERLCVAVQESTVRKRY